MISDRGLKPTTITIVRLTCFILLSFALSGCVTLTDFETAQERDSDLVGVVSPGHPLGQTFTARRGGMNNLTLWVGAEPGDEPAGKSASALIMEIFHSQSDAAPLVSRQIVPGKKGPVRVSFPPLAGKDGESYYLSLSAADGEVNIYGQVLDAYAKGTAWIDDLPVTGDIAFRATYAYGWHGFIVDLSTVLPGLWLALPLMLVLLLPGWLLLDITGIRRQLDGGEQIAISVGMSLAVIPVIMLWTSTVGLHWNKTGVRIAAAILILLVIWRLIRGQFVNGKLRQLRNVFDHFLTKNIAGLALGVVFLVSLGVRLVMVRDYAAPAWVDSVHHALITRLILQNGGFPASYEPYLNLPPTQYHAGYHSNLAAFLWLSGMGIPDGMLLYGQILNSLMVFAVYLLAVRLVKNRTIGIIAALFTGLFTPMPAYYTSWGRYTQLAGLLVMGVAFTLLQEITNHTKINRPGRIVFLAIISLSGLVLIHYRVFAFLASLLLAYGLWMVFASAAKAARIKRLSRKPIIEKNVEAMGEVIGPSQEIASQLPAMTGKEEEIASQNTLAMTGGQGEIASQNALGMTGEKPGGRGVNDRSLSIKGIVLVAITGLGAFLLILPWMWPNVTQLLLPALNPSRVGEVKFFSDFSWRFLTTALGQPVMILSLAGLTWACIRRRGFAIALLIWIGLLFFLANLSALHLPGGWLMNNTSVEIVLFIPMSILTGYLLVDLYSLLLGILPKVARVPMQWIAILIVVVTSFYAATKLLPILNPTTYLFRQADREAIAWIEQNVPAGETILINPFNWGYGLYAGNDGGYWIAPLTGRQTLPPPVLYGFESQVEQQQVVEACKQVIEKSNDAFALWDYLHLKDISYVYIGARGGPLSPGLLSDNALWRVIYARQGVYIIEVLD